MNSLFLLIIGIPAIEILVMIKIKDTVLNAPIWPPIFINKNISSAGTAINIINNGFICLIQKYMINVYLSNYE